MATIDTADNLTRNDRVIRENDPFPFLVDCVEDQEGNTVLVTYSNGDKVAYPKHQSVIIVGRE